MSPFDVYVRNFVLGARGPCSAVMVRHRESGTIAIGTVYFIEVHGEDVKTASAALTWCEANVETIYAAFQDLEDDGFVPGWSGRPWTEQQMIAKAQEEAGW